MSLIRRIWLLLLCTLLLAFGGSEAIYVGATGGALETELRLENSDDATALAQSLSQGPGPPASQIAALGARFDTGLYRSIRYASNGQPDVLLRQNIPSPHHAPSWFVAMVPITSEPGIAPVTQAGGLLGSVEVVRRTDDAHRELWRGTLRFAVGLTALGLLAGGLSALGVRRIQLPLAATVAQAEALERGDYLTVPEPKAPELRRLTRAMNSMVGRLRSVFEAQTAQVEALRRQASCDPLTGLSNRAHFLAQFGAALIREDTSAGGMVLLRVLRLAEMNRILGRKDVDRLLIAVGQTLQAYASQVRGAFLGRLNGADFALVLPEGGLAEESATALINLLQAELPILHPQTAVVAGAVEVRPGGRVAELLADADMALARAENAGPFSVMSAGEQRSEAWAGMGERGWHEQVAQALSAGRVQLGSFPVVSASGALIHLECPVRLQLVVDGRFEPAASWLPVASRSRLNSAIDERGLALALEASSRDGLARCVNISPASLLDTGFAARLRGRLRSMPPVARLMGLEIAEPVDDEQFELMRELARQVRPTGALFGIEHAGERLSRMERLFDAGIDYVKLDASITRGVATDPNRAGFASGLIAMLHSLSLLVFGEGVVDESDAAQLWAGGIDGLTGPWISAQQFAGPLAMTAAVEEKR